MSRRTLLLVVVLAVLALGVAWIATRGSDSTATADGITTTSTRPSESVVQVDLASPPEPAAQSDEAGAKRSIAEPASDFHAFPADATWIEGRVEFPPGTPRDERVFVLASGKKIAGKSEHRFEVDANGRFRAAFAPTTKFAKIDLDARYVFVPEPVRVDLSAKSELVLTPKLGGLARVRIVPSPNAAARGIDTASVRVIGQGFEVFGADVLRQELAACDARGVAEVGGLDAGMKWSAKVEAKGIESLEGVTFSPKPGEIVDLDLPVVAAARFAGIVLDERGSPIARASVVAEATSESGTWSSAKAWSDKEGRFELFVGQFGRAKLRVESPGLITANAGTFDIAEGFDRADLEIRLADGLAIGGVVRWPDGRPVDGATVSLADAADEDENVRSTKTAEDGSFRFTGLVADSTYALASRAREPEPTDGSKSGRSWWIASREDVPAGARDVALVLGAGNQLRGRVVDDLGVSVLDAFVAAEPVRDLAESLTLRERVRDRVRPEDGTFVLAGLPDGEWEVGAARKGAQVTSWQPIVMPRDAGRELRIVVPRPATVSGFVFDVDGTPAIGARVVATIGGTENDTDREVRCEADGTFRFERLLPDKVSLRAKRDDRADSAEFGFVLAPGDEVVGARLQLRRGGTIEGRVFDAEDRPIVGASLYANSSSASRPLRSTTTAADGTYRLDGVAPGSVVVFALVPDGVDGGGHENVLVEEGLVVRADFGGRPRGRIVVRGVVRARKPVANAEVAFFAMNGGEESQRATKTDAHGRYELRLTEPGNYWCGVDAGAAGSLNRTIEIPDVSEHVHDFDLGTARIAGRVLDADGKPLADANVRVQSSVNVAGTIASGGFGKTDLDGAFAFGGLLPDTYEIVVEPALRFGRRGEIRDLAPRTVSGIVLDTTTSRTDIEIRLERGARLVVRVLGANGRPASGASVRWQTSDRAGDTMRADSAGIAQLAGIPPGQVTVHAWTDVEMQREPVLATAARDVTAEVAVQLVAGGVILLRFERKDGKPVIEPWTVQHGVNDSGGRSVETEWRNVRDGGALAKGPLLPGRYEVWARIGTGIVKASVDVTAGVEVEVALREAD